MGVSLLAHLAILSAELLMIAGVFFILFDTRWITRGKNKAEFYEVEEVEAESLPKVSKARSGSLNRRVGIDQHTKDLLESYKAKIGELLTSLVESDKSDQEHEVKDIVSALADSWRGCSSYEKTTCHFLRSTFCKELITMSAIEILHNVADPDGTAKWLAERALTHMFS